MRWKVPSSKGSGYLDAPYRIVLSELLDHPQGEETPSVYTGQKSPRLAVETGSQRGPSMSMSHADYMRALCFALTFGLPFGFSCNRTQTVAI